MRSEDKRRRGAQRSQRGGEREQVEMKCENMKGKKRLIGASEAKLQLLCKTWDLGAVIVN